MVRQRKTPAERAQEALDTAVRVRDKLAVKEANLTSELTQVRKDLGQAERRVEYALDNPELKDERAADKQAVLNARPLPSELSPSEPAQPDLDVEPAEPKEIPYVRPPWEDRVDMSGPPIDPEPDYDADATDR